MIGRRGRRFLVRVVGGRRLPTRALLLPAFAVVLLGVAVRLLYMVDVSPVMHSPAQPATRMADRYSDAAELLLDGDGILYPRVWPDPSDTGLLSRPPGYPAVVAAVYALVGHSYFHVQLVQCVLSALTPVALLVLTTRVVGVGAGLAAGLLAALSPLLAFSSSVVTPDSLSSLIVALAMLLLWGDRRRPGLRFLAAGALAGAGTWLRPNLLLMGPVLAGLLPLALPRRRRTLVWGAAMAAVALGVVAPITIRNARLFGAFVPVSTNGGIVLWEGIADAGGERFGARRSDGEVATEEAERHGEPRWALWWASPDGIRRDRERVRRALAVIRENPGWYAASVLFRAGDILDLRLAATPLVEAEAPALPPDAHAFAHPALEPGRRLAPLRPFVRTLQQVATGADVVLRVVGLALLAVLAPRRAFFLALVPLYVLLMHAPLHFEPRFALPLYTFYPAFEATSWALLAGVVLRALRPHLRRRQER